jgi:metallo-beta-lactamase class B
MNHQLVFALLFLIFPSSLRHRQSLSRPSQPSQPAQGSQPQQFTLDAAFLRTLRESAEPMHIVGPINFVGTRGLGVYLISTPAGHILLGGGMPGSSSAIATSIRKLGYKPEDIKILLSNHAHFDHVGTMADLKKLSGASVEVMDGDVELLALGGKMDYLFGKDPRFYFPAVRADRVLKDGDTVELGGVKLTARRTPGHTPGCTTFITTVEEGGRSYQVVFPDGTSVNAGTRLVHNPSYPGILEDYRKTFAVLESLHPDIFLAYHIDDSVWIAKRERAATEGAQAFVDPDGYRSLVADRKARFEQLVAEEKNTHHQD